MEKHDHRADEVFMQRAIDLALLGRGSVSPNPLVGCVIVHDGLVVGEGFHQKYGEAHAEVNAIASVADKGVLKHSTLYVNLEPCSHYGKTPPCADLLIQYAVKKVVVSNLDSNPLVSGNGVRKLRAAGIEVITGLLEKEGRILNRRFFTAMEKKRPFILLKWAQTSDGFIARENGDSRWISNEQARQLVHRWRTEEDAVMVGARTAMHDNPQLNVRDWTGRDPVRVVTDRYLKLSDSLHLFNLQQPTLCYNLLRHESHHNLELVRLDEANFFEDLLKDLLKRKIQSVIVEGGANTLQMFIDRGLWDEARIFTSPQTFKKGLRAPLLPGQLRASYTVDTDRFEIFEQ